MLAPLPILALLLLTRCARAAIHADLHRLQLSHFAFHTDALKTRLARLAAPPNATVVIVGVEWGNDMAALAHAGYRVIAVEADPQHARTLRQRVQDNPTWDVRVVEAYAAATAESERQVTVDSLVSTEVAVLSVDVQGAEHEVLRGASKLLAERRVRTLWVESIACQASALHVLHMLKDEFELFDFVPWGLARGKDAKVPRTRDSFLFDDARPGGIDQYWQWLCDAQRGRYKWLQTDFLAVRKDLVDDALREKLRALPRLCQAGAKCVLRELDAVKDEL